MLEIVDKSEVRYKIKIKIIHMARLSKCDRLKYHPFCDGTLSVCGTCLGTKWNDKEFTKDEDNVTCKSCKIVMTRFTQDRIKYLEEMAERKRFMLGHEIKSQTNLDRFY